MYTLEQRERVVWLYVRYGRKATATVRELDYPKSWKKLAGWIDELPPGQRRSGESRTFEVYRYSGHPMEGFSGGRGARLCAWCSHSHVQDPRE